MIDWGTIIAGLLTLAIFTFLYGDNPIYRFAESLLIGVSIGYFLVITWQNTIVSLLIKPLVSDGRIGLIIPLGLGLLMLSRFSSRLSFLSRLPIAVLIGSGAGVAIPAMLDARTLRQIDATIAPLWTDGGLAIGTIVVVLGVLTTLAYFYFSRAQTGSLGRISQIGIYFLMVFFGTTFGYTVMSRMSTFIGRMEFLLVDFLRLTQ